MMIFRAFGGLDDFSNISSVAKWTIGSIGSPKNICAKNFIDWKQNTIDLHFKCEGNTEITDVLSSGVISFDNATDSDGLTEVFGKCFYDPEGADAEIFSLMPYFDRISFDADFLAQCAGKEKCEARLDTSPIAIPPDQKTAGQYVFL